MRASRLAVTCSTLAAAAVALAGEPAAGNGTSASADAVVDVGAKVALRATDADLARATAALGKPMIVEYRRCELRTGKCAATDERGGTERMHAWAARDATTDAMLLVTSCRTDAGWKVGRVTVRREPRKGAPAPAKPVRDDVDPKFLRASCAR